MQGPTNRSVREISSDGIEQWQFEEGLNALRRTASEAELTRHWETTGHSEIDAVARAHVAEWKTFDERENRRESPAAVVEALVQRALFDEPWQLCVVESSDEPKSVRKLRTQTGVCIDWVEGRRLPPPGTTVALRIGMLDPPDVRVATLPVEFGGRSPVRRVVMALLRKYGDSECSDWLEFMGGSGARVVVEYGLEELRRRVEAARALRAG